MKCSRCGFLSRIFGYFTSFWFTFGFDRCIFISWLFFFDLIGFHCVLFTKFFFDFVDFVPNCLVLWETPHFLEMKLTIFNISNQWVNIPILLTFLYPGFNVLIETIYIAVIMTQKSKEFLWRDFEMTFSTINHWINSESFLKYCLIFPKIDWFFYYFVEFIIINQII